MVTITDKDRFDAHLTEIRNGKDGVAYMLCGHLTFTDPKTVHVVRVGKPPVATVQDMLIHLDDGQVMYMILRLPVDGKMKFIYCHWIGQRVLTSKRGRFELVHPEIRQHFGSFDLEINTGDSTELTEDAIKAQIRES